MRKKSGGYHGHVPGKLQPMSTRDTISADERLRGVPDTALRPWKGTCMKEIQRLLTLFADAHGVSGHEGAVASLLAAELEPLVDEVTTDAMGNVVGTRNGTGSPVTLDRAMAPLANDLVTGKSFDDRAGVVMMVAAMQRLKNKKIKATVHAVGTVQEEVGLKGARTSAFSLDPDAAIISEVGIHHRQHRSLAYHHVALLFGHARVIAGDADLGDDGGVGIEAEGTGAGALETHLLLDGAHRVHRGLDLLVLQALHGCDHHDHTGPIVETLTGDEIVGERRHRSVECHGRPDLYPQRGRVLSVRCADVYEHVLDLDDLLA